MQEWEQGEAEAALAALDRIRERYEPLADDGDEAAINILIAVETLMMDYAEASEFSQDG